MSATNGGRGQTAVAAVVLVGLLSVAAVAGVMFTGATTQDADRTGEEILTDVNEKYNSADSVVTDAVVTIERSERTRQFELSAASAGEAQMRLNVSDGDRYLLFGTDGDVVWVHDPETTLTGVLERTDEGVTGTIRAGTDEPTGLGLSSLSGQLDDIDPNTTVSELLAESDEQIPPQYEAVLAEIPENTTVGDLLEEQGLDADANLSEVLAGSDTVGEFEQFDESALPEQFGEFEFDNATIPDNWAKNWSEAAERYSDRTDRYSGNETAALEELLEQWKDRHNVSTRLADAPESWNFSKERVSRRMAEFDSEFDPADADVDIERVGTPTIDGTDTYELLVTGPADDTEYRIWVAQESETVVKQRLTTDAVTVTIDVVDTRFDVAAAASTFEPPGTTTVAEGEISTVSTASQLDEQTAFDLATPSADWEFENGTYATSEVGPLGAVLPALPDSATSVYTDGTTSLVITQTGAQRDLPAYVANETESITLDGQTVQVSTTERGTLARWTTDETTLVVAGDLSRERLESVVTALDG